MTNNALKDSLPSGKRAAYPEIVLYNSRNGYSLGMLDSNLPV